MSISDDDYAEVKRRRQHRRASEERRGDTGSRLLANSWAENKTPYPHPRSRLESFREGGGYGAAEQLPPPKPPLQKGGRPPTDEEKARRKQHPRAGWGHY